MNNKREHIVNSMEYPATNVHELCIEITKKLNLDSKDLHVAAVFESNDSNEIIGWAILDWENNIVKRYDDLKELWDDASRQ